MHHHGLKNFSVKSDFFLTPPRSRFDSEREVFRADFNLNKFKEIALIEWLVLNVSHSIQFFGNKFCVGVASPERPKTIPNDKGNRNKKYMGRVYYNPTIRSLTILKFEKLSFVNQPLRSRAEMMGIRALQHQHQHQYHDVNNHVMIHSLLKSSDIPCIISDGKNISQNAYQHQVTTANHMAENKNDHRSLWEYARWEYAPPWHMQQEV